MSAPASGAAELPDPLAGRCRRCRRWKRAGAGRLAARPRPWPGYAAAVGGGLLVAVAVEVGVQVGPTEQGPTGSLYVLKTPETGGRLTGAFRASSPGRSVSTRRTLGIAVASGGTPAHVPGYESSSSPEASVADGPRGAASPPLARRRYPRLGAGTGAPGRPARRRPLGGRRAARRLRRRAAAGAPGLPPPCAEPESRPASTCKGAIVQPGTRLGAPSGMPGAGPRSWGWCWRYSAAPSATEAAWSPRTSCCATSWRC